MMTSPAEFEEMAFVIGAALPFVYLTINDVFAFRPFNTIVPVRDPQVIGLVNALSVIAGTGLTVTIILARSLSQPVAIVLAEA